MKKILTIIAVAVLAVAAQAVSFDWKSGTIMLPDSNGKWSTQKAGSGDVAAYYFAVDAAAFDGFKAADDFASRFDVDEKTGAITLKKGVTATYDRKTTGGGAANWTKQEATTTPSYVLAFYTYTDEKGNAFYIANNANAYLTAADSADASGKFSDLCSSVGEANGWNVANVPEPTSLALIALGVAAFGLKRKVA